MACKEENEIDTEDDCKRRKVLNVLKLGYVAPDGGWGWVIVIATGFAHVFSLAIMVCFGLIFRDSFRHIGINASQTTMLLNINSAVSSVSGLANGPLFRKYSYRQIACIGGFICAMSICALSFMRSFYGILIFFSILYASSTSFLLSANMLSLITYFKKKRRLAVGLSWACSGIGAIVNPQLTTILMSIYDMPGTVLLFGGLALNTIVCGLVLQPVGLHAKRDMGYKSIKNSAKRENIKEHNDDTSGVLINESREVPSLENIWQRDKLTNQVEKRSSQRCESQYLYCGDQESGPAVVDVPLGKSLESLSNGGWQSRKTINDINPMGQFVTTKSPEYKGDDENPKENDCGNLDDNTGYLLGNGSTVIRKEVEEREQKKIQWCTHAFRSMVIFFDLDLLQDFIFVNLMIGVSFDHGLKDIEIATVMSVLAGVDVLTRIIISIIATRVGWDNKTFFLIGLGSTALSRIVLAHLSSYTVIMTIVVLWGIGKSFIIVFSTLIIPAHVPLEKLPGATGLNHVAIGIIYVALGPLLGWFRDTLGNYTIMLHFLNAISFFVIISWILVDWCCSRKRQRLERIKVLGD